MGIIERKSREALSSLRSRGGECRIIPLSGSGGELHTIGQIALNLAAASITCGGLYDMFVRRLPANLSTMCQGNPLAAKLARELLRALGGSLVAVGLTTAVLVNFNNDYDPRSRLVLVLLLVVPSEGVNAIGMYRVGSPFYVPLAFILLVLVGVSLA